MADEQIPQPAQPKPSPYPHFPPTSEGLAIFYRDFGRLHHLAIEQELTIGKLSQHGQQVLETADALREHHAPGKCRPIEAANGHAEMPSPAAPLKAAGRTRGG